MKTIASIMLGMLCAAGLLLVFAKTYAQTDLGVAEYTADNELVYPDDLDSWIVMGASLGADYNDGIFDPETPGVIGVVQMEPTAYRFFLENGEYMDGTMFLLSFFNAESKSEPQLQGFVQGERISQEIHVIDKRRFAEGSGFFLYPEPGGSSGKIPDGSACFQCHTAEGQYDATFTQFYPAIRDLIGE